jgi:MFS family permease
MAFQPAGTLNNRTFIGLIIAQFLAGFNDQAIHAAAMFYAIHRKILTQATAISLMPILFFAPWAIFCTISGYLADRHSKTTALRIWKIAEIFIALILILGFYLGTVHDLPAGAWIVMSTVFLMGTHAAFFAPAKYGAMPEILQPHLLSKGNGVLESTTFLASILGTVTGGLLSFIFENNEIWIGVIILGLSIIGAVASYLIAMLPASNPTRLFPKNLFKPLVDNLKVIFRSRPLALAALGIAFFVFMVAYMRAALYMHGETRNPRWDELHTSLVVATVALGVGLGSPLAGWLSGGKIELGLVPLGCLGMISACLLAAAEIEHTAPLVVALIVIGFFSGFYMVPLYTLLQHRAPKASKGDLVATSNFINVTGAILASVLFRLLVTASQYLNFTPTIPVQDEIAAGYLVSLEEKHGKVLSAEVLDITANRILFRAKNHPIQEELDVEVVDFEGGGLELITRRLDIGDEVVVCKYTAHGVIHHLLRAAGTPTPVIYDNEVLPRYLFLGAALMTLGILLLLCWKLPDFFTRTLFWLRSLGRFQLKAVGMQYLPTSGPVILATNADTLLGSMQVVAVTDRTTKVLLLADGKPGGLGGLARSLAKRTSIVELHAGKFNAAEWDRAKQIATRTLANGHLLAISVDSAHPMAEIETLLKDLRAATGATVVPTYCGEVDATPNPKSPRVRVVFGEALAQTATLAETRQAIHQLGEWVRHNEEAADSQSH